MKYLTLSLPGFGQVQTPPNIPSGASSPSDIINLGLALLVTLGIVASLVFVLYGGVLWATSQGDKAKVDRARRTITYAIVGLIIVILSFTIIRVVGYLLGASLLTKFGM